MNTTLYNRTNYVEKQIVLRLPEDKNSCLQLLTQGNHHFTLCHNYYSEKHINLIIESSDYIIFRHDISNVEEIVGFALVKMEKNRVLDILLLCAIPNDKQFVNMITRSVCVFALGKKCRKIFTSPRTPALRETCIKYGFESFRGVETFDELLVKKIDMRKQKRKNIRKNNVCNSELCIV